MKNTVLGLSSDLHFYIYQKPILFNAGINRLMGYVINEMKMDPMDGNVYIFVSRDRKQIKLLHYSKNVFTLYTRRIHHGVFVYPEYNEESDTYRLEQRRLRLLLNGYITRNRVSQKYR